MISTLNAIQQKFLKIQALDFLAPLALRLYLAPIMWMAGMQKLNGFDNTVAWFGNSDWGLGLAFPTLLAGLATGTEVIGAVCLFLGLAVRWISIPLLLTMLIAALTVHIQNGWLAIAEGTGFFATERTIASTERLSAAKSILQEHGNYQWLTEYGNFVILNNGIEFAMTYSIMLLVLLFIGAGRYVSLDYWLQKKFFKFV